MTPPRRWLNDPGRAPDGATELLRKAGRTRSMPEAVYARSAARIAGISTSAAGTSAAVAWLKPLAGLLAVGLAGALVTTTLHPAQHPSTERRAHTTLPRPVTTAVTPAPVGPSQAAEAPTPQAPAVVEAHASPLAPQPLAEPPGRPLLATTLPPPRSHLHAVVSRTAHLPPETTPTELPAPPAEAAPTQTATLAGGGSAGGYVAPSASADDPLRHENLLLGQARDALSTDPAEALHRLDAYDTACPNHLLGDLRDFLSVQALLRLGRGDDARRRVESSLQRYPHGLYNQAMRRLITTVPDARPGP